MKSLRELVNMQTLTGESDFEIIYDWFIENDKELEGITLMEKLARGKAEKLGNELGRIKGHLSMYNGTYNLYEEFGPEIGGKLDHIIVLHILGFDIEKDYPQYWEWLKETIPTLKCPLIFWRDFNDWLGSKGIYFKGAKK